MFSTEPVFLALQIRTANRKRGDLELAASVKGDDDVREAVEAGEPGLHTTLGSGRGIRREVRARELEAAAECVLIEHRALASHEGEAREDILVVVRGGERRLRSLRCRCLLRRLWLLVLLLPLLLRLGRLLLLSSRLR